MGSTTTPAARRVKIISEDIVRPSALASQSILKAFLEKGVNKCSSRDTTPSPTNVGCRESPKEKLSLLEGLGEDFLTANPPNNDIVEFYLEGLGDAFFSADPTDIKVEQAAPQTECINQVAVAPTDPPLQQSRPPSPIIGANKRKMRRGGKGVKKICRPSSKDMSSSTSSSSQVLVFSQAEDKAVVQNFKNIISVAAEKRKYYEGLQEESRTQRESIVRRKEEAEAQQQIHDNYLNQALDQMKQLKKTIADQRATCRENSKLIESLKIEEKKITRTDNYNQEQLNKYSGRLSKLQQITLDTL